MSCSFLPIEPPTVFFFSCSREKRRRGFQVRTFIDVFSTFVGPDQARPDREQHRIGLLSVSEINLFEVKRLET